MLRLSIEYAKIFTKNIALKIDDRFVTILLTNTEMHLELSLKHDTIE